jgi:predicted RNA-binding protein with PUA-like domain
MQYRSARSNGEEDRMARGFWLVKTEPVKYGWDDLVRDGCTSWDGVRNHAARNHLAAMRKGDLVLYYHSNEGKEVVGIARVRREAYPDPTADDERWVVVDLEPVRALAEAVSLASIKADAKLRDIPLVRQSRLSVMPIVKPAFDRILALGRTKLPRR